MSQRSLETRIVAAAEEALARQKFVTPVDVCVGIGWLHPVNVRDWEQGRVANLEELLPVHDERMAEPIMQLRRWAQDKGLTLTEDDYLAATRDRRPLRFTDTVDPRIEQAWRERWTQPGLPAGQQKRIAKVRAAPPDLVVISPVKDWTCAQCHDTGDLLIMDGGRPLCMTCADMDHLVFLPAGDAALTRRAKKASRLSAVVVRWSKSRKRYERQGILVEEAALEEAEQQCLSDSDARMRRRERDRERRAVEDVEFQRRFAAEIGRLFPGCPPERADAIASHTALRGSGRVGRSAAGRSLDEQAVTLAVVASIRHENTEYDDLLMSGAARQDARDQVRDAIDQFLASWSV
jgi:hypothetical protein